MQLLAAALICILPHVFLPCAFLHYTHELTLSIYPHHGCCGILYHACRIFPTTFVCLGDMPLQTCLPCLVLACVL